MDQYGPESAQNEPVYLEEEPLMTTSRHEIMSYLVPQTAGDNEDIAF